MKRLLILALVIAGGGTLGVGQPLQARSWIAFIPFQTATELVLWDPPEEAIALGYRFQVLQPPKHGTLAGEGPVRTYIPDIGFYGTDLIQFLVFDPLENFDIGIVRLVVLPGIELVERPAPYPFALGLSFRSSILAAGMPLDTTLGPGTATLFIKNRLGEQDISWSWGASGFSVLTTRFRMEVAIAGTPRIIIPLTATLTFDPSVPGLSLATVQATAPLPGIRLDSAVTYSPAAPAASMAMLSAQTMIGGLTVEGASTWRFIPVEFSSLNLRLSGPASAWGCPGCPFRLEGGVAFQKDGGFSSLWWTARDLPLPCPACDVLRAYLDARVEFTTNAKKVVPSLRLEANWSVCLRPFVEVVVPPTGFGWEGLDIYGVEIKCELPSGWGFRSATSFVEARNGTVTGDGRFFEVWQLHGPVPSCCGPQGRWQVSNFFRRTAGSLFCWGLTEVQLNLSLDEQFSVRFVARFGEVDPADPSKTWSLRIELSGLLGG